MSYDIPSDFNDLRQLKREIQILRDELVPSVVSTSLDTAGFGFGSMDSNNPIVTGNTTYDPREVTESSNSIDVIGTSMIVTASGNPTVNTLNGTSHNGQIIILKPKEGKTLTLSTGGNIDISSNQTIADNEFAILKYYEDASNKYLVIKGGSSGGNTTSFVGWTADDDLDMSTRNIENLDQVIFSTSTSSDDVLSTSKYGIEADGGTSPTGIRYHVPLGKLHKFYVNGNVEMQIGDSYIDLQDQSGNRKKIINVDTPTTDYHVANKKYVDDNSSSGGISNPVNAHLSLGGYQLQRISALYLDGSSNNDHTIDGHSSGISYNVDDDNDYHYFKVENDTRFQVGHDILKAYKPLDMDDEGIQNLSHLYLNCSQANDASISGSNLGVSYNVPSNDKHLFQVNGVLVGEWSNSSLIVANSFSVNGATVLGNSYTDGIFTLGTWRSSILMGDNETIRCGDSGSGRYIGIHVSNKTDMGSKGTLEGPYDESSNFPSSSSTLDNLFGDENGSIGVYADTNYTTGYRGRFYYKADDDWYMVTGSKV